MEKNTKLAIALSALVLIVTFVIEFVVILPKQQAALEQQQIEQANAEKEKEEKETQIKNQISSVEKQLDQTSTIKEIIPEQQYTIRTDKIEAVFTNKGGDIISYKLLEHKDKDTDSAIQMADSITSSNRAFALSFGGKDNSIINDTFSVKKDGENTIIFTKDLKTRMFLVMSINSHC